MAAPLQRERMLQYDEFEANTRLEKGYPMAANRQETRQTSASGQDVAANLAAVGDAVETAVSNGGEIVTARYPEGNLLVARVGDPAGNVIGLWQEASR